MGVERELVGSSFSCLGAPPAHSARSPRAEPEQRLCHRVQSAAAPHGEPVGGSLFPRGRAAGVSPVPTERSRAGLGAPHRLPGEPVLPREAPRHPPSDRGRSPPPRPAQSPGVERSGGAGTEPLLPPGEAEGAAAAARRGGNRRERGGPAAGTEQERERPRSAARLARRARCWERSASLAARC